ncbi:GGDEF domain-containing protein [Psychrosphaera saromensis]|uniref:diguanylate cyclase n=1 Tax=Psychrosphaera saromensis TaxID=716813 RepID=A0A2S7US33_9GAMM|nr:GGDEF domain-containing protein [Psychrosphaera saromensis]PQJ52558.1 hypothetical protein BTO11_02100 [Psychrosphaera saromensis]GHB69435.1 GGDEF domain-containing protein [Psychrosphaera saromensis]GLQ13027.1 GGDEF domain-containing protein [Psychrosphaera saromensis]
MPDVIHKIIHRLTVAYLIGIVPFGILNFINGDILIGLLIAVICCNLVYIDASMHRKKTYNSTIAFGVLMPIVYFLLYQLVVDKGIIGILWCFPTILIVNFIMPQRQAVIANILTLGILTPAILTQFDMAVVIRMYASLIIVAALANLFVNIITEQHLKLSELAVKDPLTGLLNRLTLEDNITLAIQQHNRTLNPMTLVSIDIDHFKLINDKYGHDAGDQVIIEIATLLKQRCRSVDQVYRLGGEEFLVVLLNTDLKNAQSFSTSVQEKLTEINFEHGLTPTLSIGLAEIEKDKTWNECLKQADDNLYLAKNNGRNTIIG